MITRAGAPSLAGAVGSEGRLVAARHQRASLRLGTLLALAAPVAALVLAGWGRRWASDDAFINFRVVEQLLAGNGPVFNAGERVEVGTSPLWVVILALTSLVGLPVEWVAVLLGLTLAGTGLGLAQLAAARLVPSGRRRPLIVPAGALVVAALPPFWDFATSGLETGLSFAWLGACGWRLALHRPAAPDSERRVPVRLAALLGLGPLIRPDFVIFSAVLLVALTALERGSTLRWRARTAGAAIAAPVAYQVFRMAYYGLLVPNTALAKEASDAWWDQGLRYLVDLFVPYALWAPLLLLLGACWAPSVLAAARAADHRRIVLLVAPVVGGTLHGLYVVRVGGDFMHGRLLLPSVFAVLLPVAAVALDRSSKALALASLVPWVAACALVLRVGYDEVGPDGIGDERGFYVYWAGHEHPVTLDDYRTFVWTAWGERLQALDEAAVRAVVIDTQYTLGPPIELARAGGGPPGVVAAELNIGLLAFAAGVEVHVVDGRGLTDPLAGRVRTTGHTRPGHDKYLPAEWIVARFAAAGQTLPGADVDGARRALGCGPIPALLDAVTEPLSPGRLLANIGVALRHHATRIDPVPAVAVAQLCERPRPQGP